MPIISKVGRRSPRIRFLFGLIYATLILGSAMMVYPFAVMVSGSFKSPVDLHDYDVIPRYFHDDIMLFRKYIEERSNESTLTLSGLYRTDIPQFEEAYPPAVYSSALCRDWRDFLQSDRWVQQFPQTNGRIPISFFELGCYLAPSFKQPQMHREWTQRLMDRFDTVEEMNRALGTSNATFLTMDPFRVSMFIEQWFSRRFSPPDDSPFYDTLVEFKKELRETRPRFLLPLSGDGVFLTTYLFPKYTNDIHRYNEAHGTRYTSYRQVHLVEQAPWRPASAQEWQEFLLGDDWRLRNIRLTSEGEQAFREYLVRHFGSRAALEKAFGLEEGVRFEVPAPVIPDEKTHLSDLFRGFLFEEGLSDRVYLLTVHDWEQFVRHEMNIQYIRITPGGEAVFREYLRTFYTEAGESDPERLSIDVFRERYGAGAPEGAATLEEAVQALPCPQPVPPNTRLSVDFEAFVSTECPLDEIRLVTLDLLFSRYLEEKYGSVDALNREAAATRVYPLGSAEELEKGLSDCGRLALDVMRERKLGSVAELIRAVDADLAARSEGSERPTLLARLQQPTEDHLKAALDSEERARLRHIIEIERAAAQPYASFCDVVGQEHARDWEDLQRFRGEIKREFIFANYRYVLYFILFHGRALFNTAVLVIAMIGCALTVNPLAAYALSRYQLPSTYKVLLFFMATMAFPAEVTMIPNFLLLKNFPFGYMLQGAILIALFLLGRRVIGRRYPLPWRGIEGALLLLGGVLLSAVTWLRCDHMAELMNVAAGSRLAYVLTVGFAVALMMLLLSHRVRRERAVSLRVPAWGLVLGVLTVLVTPLAARAFGANPTSSLLNTFWALILPTMANGYYIFLLKGFYDSLPQTLYEAAEIEGASEMWMFYRVTLPLSKPIMAVIALQAFTFAYTTFMYAFIVCQDEKMWTLMVYIYELQLMQPQFVVFAALILAAIPTLAIFVIAQRIILRGIIIPVEK